MKTLAHLSDAVLRRELIAAVARDRLTTAELLAHMAEFDARKLYVPEGYSSMHAYCVEELHLSEDAAYKRIQAARAARRFPALLDALGEGRLHLAAVCLLVPHLTAENAHELIDAAAHRKKSEVEDLLAVRLSQLPILHAESLGQLAPGQVERDALPGHTEEGLVLGSNHVELAPGQVGPAPSRCHLLHLSFPQSTHAKLAYASELLSHAIPSGDAVQVLDRALDALIATLEKGRVGVGRDRTRRSGPVRARDGSAPRARYIPARVRLAVWERDGGQCTFVGKGGHRCGARRFLQFDHVEPVARGGKATLNGIRLRCRAHNQYEAERVFGSEFMRQKREEARLAAVEARSRREARKKAEARKEAGAPNEAEAREEAEARAHADREQQARDLAREQAKDVLAGLRGLGCRPDQAKRAAQFVETLSCDTLEERMRAALGFLNRASARFSVSASAG